MNRNLDTSNDSSDELTVICPCLHTCNNSGVSMINELMLHFKMFADVSMYACMYGTDFIV